MKNRKKKVRIPRVLRVFNGCEVEVDRSSADSRRHRRPTDRLSCVHDKFFDVNLCHTLHSQAPANFLDVSESLNFFAKFFKSPKAPRNC